MEPLGGIPELNWDVVDESELVMAQLLGADVDKDPREGIESMFRSDHDASSCDWYWPTDVSSCTMSDPIMTPVAESMNICLLDPNVNQFPDVTNHKCYSVAVEEHVPLPKRKAAESGIDNENEDEAPTENPKKSARDARPKRVRKSARSEEKEESINGSYSEDNSNIYQEVVANVIDGTSLNSSAKGRIKAGRGSATDPQSLYARKRRERINERLKILQNLVPNGTKVDISTMLEEAVQYVKFLQLQIKLLSSDDMWMYAPLAYNGMDIGLDIKIPFLQTNNKRELTLQR